MKITRQDKEYYYATGYMGEYLTQYSIMKIGGFWSINRTYGYGPHFNMAYKTKRECIEIIKAYGN